MSDPVVSVVPPAPIDVAALEDRVYNRVSARFMVEAIPSITDALKTHIDLNAKIVPQVAQPSIFTRFYQSTKGFWTALACLILAVAPAVIEKLADIDWTTLGISPALAAVIAAIFFVLRARTNTPIFSGARDVAVKDVSNGVHS